MVRLRPRPIKTGCYQAFLFVTFAQFLKSFNALRRLQITDTTLDKDPRFGALRAWLATLDLGAGELRRASDDASFRRYFRYSTGTESFIAMDAPPEQENSQPFVKVAEDLKAMKLNAPRVIASDLQQGFLLLSDLGDAPYLDVLQAHPERAEELYGDAIFALRMMQNRGAARAGQPTTLR